MQGGKCRVEDADRRETEPADRGAAAVRQEALWDSTGRRVTLAHCCAACYRPSEWRGRAKKRGMGSITISHPHQDRGCCIGGLGT